VAQKLNHLSFLSDSYFQAVTCRSPRTCHHSQAMAAPPCLMLSSTMQVRLMTLYQPCQPPCCAAAEPECALPHVLWQAACQQVLVFYLTHASSASHLHQQMHTYSAVARSITHAGKVTLAPLEFMPPEVFEDQLQVREGEEKVRPCRGRTETKPGASHVHCTVACALGHRAAHTAIPVPADMYARTSGQHRGVE
jgi:hypothetical protein